MAAQQPVDPTFFKETRPTVIRIWHWMAFLFFTASIVTVLFGSTMFRTRNNTAMVQEQVRQQGGTVTEAQARSVAHEYSDKLWMLHTYIGYGLSFLLLMRIVSEIYLSRSQKLRFRLKTALRYPSATEGKTHYLVVEYGYLVFYMLFILMALTGLVMALEDVGWLKPFHRSAKNIHGIVQYGLYGYMVLHIIGVILADLGRYSGIVSRMINGKPNIR